MRPAPPRRSPCCWSPSSATAAVTKSFRQTTAKDFEEGEATAQHGAAHRRRRAGDEVDADHARRRVRLVRRALRPTARPPTSAPAIRGASTPSTPARPAARARLVSTLEAAWVTALAVRPDGTLIAGTTPGGRVYTVDPKSGKSKLFATLTAEHVWALALDGKSGTVYAGTGGPGKIVRHRRRRPRAHRLGLGRQARRVAARRRRQAPATPAPPRKRSSTRSALDGRAEALADFDAEEVRALARSGGARLRGGQRLRARRRGRPLAGRAPPPRRRAPRSPPRRPARRRRRDRCRAPASARPRPRSTASTPTGAWSRCSRSPTATSRRWRSTTTAAPTSAPAARAASTASPPIAPRRWRSTSPSGRR